MGAVNTNSISLAAIREDALGQLPATGTAEYLEPNDISAYGAEISTTARNPISKNRMNKKGTITDLTSSVAFTQDTTASMLLQFLEGGIYAKWQRHHSWLRTQISVAGGKFVPSVPMSGALIEGTIIFCRGFVDNANNGLKIVGAGSTATKIATTDSASLVAEAGSAGTSVFVVGHQAPADDIQIDAAGNITSIVTDFTTLGLEIGQGIFLGGLDPATRFATGDNNYGLCRVRKVGAHLLTVDKRSTAWTANLGAGKTVHIYAGWFIKDVPVDDPQFKEHSFAFEAAYPGIDNGSEGYEYAVGNSINTMEISLPLSDKSETSITTFGMDVLPITTARKPWTLEQPLFLEGYATSNDFLRLRVERADELGLSTLFKECTLTLGNNAGGENVLGHLGPKFVNYGNFDASLAFTCIFTSPEITKMIRNNCTVTMDFALANSDGTFYFDVPAMTLGDGAKDFAVNEKVKIGLSSTGHGDPAFGYTIGITFFPYIPNPKSDSCI